ncbi:MAG: DEAD/DEAH box helicase [Spirochaetes bacterium]|nr:DEAD/DEAH box helicase [Spirochaetota bacterium]
MDFSIFDSIKEKIIIDTGEKYYLENFIKDYEVTLISDENISIKGINVIDDKMFSSEIIFNVRNNKIESSICTCDEEGNFCSHRASLLIKLIYDSKSFIVENKFNVEKFKIYSRNIAKERFIKKLKKISEKYSIKVLLILEDRINSEIRFRIDFYHENEKINFYTDIPYSEKWDEQRNFNYTLFPLKDRLIIKTITEWIGHIPEEEFSLPKEKVDLFMKILSDFPEIYDYEYEEKLTFDVKYFKPKIILNLKEDFSEINIEILDKNFKIFSGEIYQWIIINNCIYPLRVKLNENIWENLINDKFILLGNEISTFYYELYPKIKNAFDISLKGNVELEEVESYEYLFTIDYDGNILIYPKVFSEKYKIPPLDIPFSNPEVPYISFYKDNKYYVIKRNLVKEKKILFLLKKYNFIIENNILKQKDKLYYKKFLEEGPNILKKEAAIEYTESFKKINLEKLYIFANINFEDSPEHQNIIFINEKYIFSDGTPVSKDAIEKIMAGKRFVNVDENLTLVENYAEIQELLATINSIIEIFKDDNKKEAKKIVFVSQLFYLYDEIINIIKKFNAESNIKISLSPNIEKMIYLREMILNEKDITVLKKTISIPEEVSSIMRNYQKYGFYWFHFLKEFQFGGILADDMGLGKTLQILAFIKSLNTPKPSLIICPTSLMHNWENEIKKFFPTFKTIVIKGNINERKREISHINRYDLVITSYSLIRNDIDLYEIYDFEVIVLDEANHIKNPNTKISNTVKKLNSTYRFVLTGTPIENNLKELWSIFSFVSPHLLGKFKPFKEKYIDEFTEEKLEELKQKIAPFILRRIKSEVLKELPPKIIQTLFADLTPIQQKLYQEVLEKTRESLLEKIRIDGIKKSKIHILTALLKLRQISNHPSLINPSIGIGDEISGKMDLLKELLIELTDSNHKILLFSQFTKMLALIQQEVEILGIKYSYLDGSLSETQRKKEIETFKNTDTPLFLISLKAGGYGLNLTEADTVILVDPWWNPMVEMQAIDRSYRIGQVNSVNVYKLISSGTIEEKIINLQERKKALFDNVMSIDNIFASLSEDEIEEMLS